MGRFGRIRTSKKAICASLRNLRPTPMAPDLDVVEPPCAATVAVLHSPHETHPGFDVRRGMLAGFGVR
jgi:hypothetical protein